MGVSALRVAACAGLLLGGLMLGASTAGLAVADPGGARHGPSDEQSSKGANSEHAGLPHVIRRILSEHRKRARTHTRDAPQAKIGSKPDSDFTASESNVASFAEVDEAPAPEVAPEVAPDDERGADPAGTEEGAGADGVAPVDGTDPGGGSDYIDSTVVGVAPEAEKQPDGLLGFPFPYYLLELRRGGGDWWNAERIVSRFEDVMRPYLAMPRKPEPEPVPAPAFRGGAPEPEPVLDASGGVTGGGSDYQATGFSGAPVLSAPIIAMPVPPPAAARFPSLPPAATSAPGVGSAAARAAGAEPAANGTGSRTAGGQEQLPAGTVKAMSGQAPRQGYTDYLRSPGLPQLAGAALPGVAGILLMTLGGGIIGYRQADAGRMIRTSGAARYLP